MRETNQKEFFRFRYRNKERKKESMNETYS